MYCKTLPYELTQNPPNTCSSTSTCMADFNRMPSPSIVTCTEEVCYWWDEDFILPLSPVASNPALKKSIHCHRSHIFLGFVMGMPIWCPSRHQPESWPAWISDLMECMGHSPIYPAMENACTSIKTIIVILTGYRHVKNEHISSSHILTFLIYWYLIIYISHLFVNLPLFWGVCGSNKMWQKWVAIAC